MDQITSTSVRYLDQHLDDDDDTINDDETMS